MPTPDNHIIPASHYAKTLSRAAAIRALHTYRAARERTKDRGADLTELIEPPEYSVLTALYLSLVEECIDHRIESAGDARVAIDLLSTIATDQQLGDILDEGGPVPIEKDRADMLRLITELSGWVNECDIAEAIETERAARKKVKPGNAILALASEIKAELRRRAEAIVAEHGQVPSDEADAIVEAERRLASLRDAGKKLHDEFHWDADTEAEIIEPTLTAAENALVDFIESSPAESLKAVAAKVRELMIAEPPDQRRPLCSILAGIERLAAGGVA